MARSARSRAVAEKQEIVRVAEVGAMPLRLGDAVVQAIQVKVPPELACQVADRQAPGPGHHRHPVIAGKEAGRRFGPGAEAGENLPAQGQHARAAQLTGQFFQEDRVIDLVKEFRDIAFQDMAVPVHQPTAAFPGRRGAFPHLAGEAPGQKAALQQRLQAAAQGMVHHPVLERRGRDPAPLGPVDLEKAVAARLPGSAGQRGAQAQQGALPPQPPVLHVGPAGFVALRQAGRHPEILRRGDFRERAGRAKLAAGGVHPCQNAR